MVDVLNSDGCIEAYTMVFNKTDAPHCEVVYSGRLKAFNARVAYKKGHCAFQLSKSWVGVDKDIQRGCIQSLFCKIYKHPIVDRNDLDLYEAFLKRLHLGGQKDIEDAELEVAYERVVDECFDGFFDRCSVRWGQDSFRTMGHYNFTTDTITLSTLLQGKDELLRYVLYHEMLHKKHKFTGGRKRTTYHTTAFRADERLFPDQERLERELSNLSHSHRKNVLWRRR